MDILLKPDALSLVGSMNHFVIAATSDISFVLKSGDTVVIQHTYTPGPASRVEINLESIVTPLLSFKLSDVSEPYRQQHIVKSFTAVITPVTSASPQPSPVTHTFSVLRAGVDHFADSAENFLKGNFLTWQPTLKPVTYYTPEFLTYYALLGVTVRCKAYVSMQGSSPSSSDITLATIGTGEVWTIPVGYAVIAAKLGKLPSYYDVWVEDAQGQRLTYIQRYHASDVRSQQEQWILFENSLGGIDTFRAYGDSENTAKHTHNVVEIENDSEEYRVDTEREFKKNTGFLNRDERRWLLDFFPSLAKYLYVDSYIRRIVVTDSDVTYQARELPSSYTFTYKYADARPYLNLPRTDTPPEVLDVKIPDVGSFTIAPRLVEFPRQTLSEGALFPVQSPYSETWGTTTTAALFTYITKAIAKAYKGDGSFGHTHDNMSVLMALNRAGLYLTLNAQKISAGFADKAAVSDELAKDSPDWNKILRSDVPGAARELITFLKGIAFSAGQGIDGDGNATLRSLRLDNASIDQAGHALLESVRSPDFKDGGTLLDGTGFGLWKDKAGRTHVAADIFEARRKAYFAELEVRKFSFSSGDTGYTRAGCRIDVVRRLPGGDYRCFFLAEDDDVRISNDFHVGDQAMARTGNIISKTTQMAQNRYYWRLVVAVDDAPVELEDGRKYHYIDLSDTRGTVTLTIGGKDHLCVGCDTSVENDAPQAEDKLVQLGSQTDDTRQYAYIVYVSTGQRVDYNGINDYDLGSHAFVNISKRGIELNADYLHMTHGGTGQTVNIVNERGAWYQGAVSGHYDRWSHDNATWLCNIEKGKTTTSEPRDGSPEWVKETYGQKGDPGKDGKGVTNFELLLASGSLLYRDGQEHVATLAVSYIKDGEDVSDKIPLSRLVWSRKSEAPPADDQAWGQRHANAGTSISLDYTDMAGKTDIICKLLDKNDKVAAQGMFSF